MGGMGGRVRSCEKSLPDVQPVLSRVSGWPLLGFVPDLKEKSVLTEDTNLEAPHLMDAAVREPVLQAWEGWKTKL